MIPDLQQIASLRLVCHDLYDAVETVNPWKMLSERLSLAIPDQFVPNYITLEDWKAVFIISHWYTWGNNTIFLLNQNYPSSVRSRFTINC